MRSNPVILIVLIVIAVYAIRLSWEFWSDLTIKELAGYLGVAVGLFLIFRWLGFLPFWAGGVSLVAAPYAYHFARYLDDPDKNKSKK